MKQHTGKEWDEGRQAALNRDDHRCQDCGRFSELHVHHIKRPEEFEVYEDSHNPSNLVTLCKWCHPRWEGREARPILLNEDYTLQSIVTELAADTVERLTYKAAAKQMLKTLVIKNGQVCNKCYRPRGSYGTQPAAHIQSYIRTLVQNVVYGMDMDLPVRRTDRGWRYPESRTEFYCDQCAADYAYYNDDVKTEEFVKSAWRISEVLAVQGVGHNGQLLADVGAQLKSGTRMEDIDRYTAITEHAILEGQEEIVRPDWLQEEMESSQPSRAGSQSGGPSQVPD